MAEGVADAAMLHPGVTNLDAQPDALDGVAAEVDASPLETPAPGALEVALEAAAEVEPAVEAVDPEPETLALADETRLAGRKLTEARLARGWSIEEVAARILVRPEFLQALEDMNVKILPGKAYALAFLRSYARELGLDEGAIIDQFRQESALTREDVNKQIRSPSSRPHRERPWIWAAALVIATTGFVGWRALITPGEEVAVESAAPNSDSPAPSAGPEQTAAPTRVLEIKALADGWLEARGPDGTVFLSRTLHAGEVYRPDPSAGWTLHARDGGAFEVFVNGRTAGLLGNAGLPVLGRSMDEIQPAVSAEGAPPRG